MLPESAISGSAGGGLRSASSIAGPSAPIAATVAARSAPPGRSARMYTAISGSATG
jgi:hypothetical protein